MRRMYSKGQLVRLIEEHAGEGQVLSVNGKTGAVVLNGTDIKLTTNQQTVQDNFIRVDEAIDGKSTVSVSGTGTATDEISYITVDGVEKKIAGGGGGTNSDYIVNTTYSIIASDISITKDQYNAVCANPMHTIVVAKQNDAPRATYQYIGQSSTQWYYADLSDFSVNSSNLTFRGYTFNKTQASNWKFAKAQVTIGYICTDIATASSTTLTRLVNGKAVKDYVDAHSVEVVWHD